MSQPPTKFSPVDANSKAATLKRLRLFSRLLDKAIPIPGTNVGIGLDPILGLIPAGGDFLGVVLSAYIIFESARLGASKKILGKMVSNIVIDALLGVIPILGDIFDIAWAGNQRNMALLEQHLQSSPHGVEKADKLFLFLLVIGLLLLAVGVVAFAIIVMRLLWVFITGS
ncbi:MAG: DUF4112 domain-containing protein [Richelia sp.]|nr:DUF4112 domain-containing protein [Richelia sp.]